MAFEIVGQSNQALPPVEGDAGAPQAAGRFEVVGSEAAPEQAALLPGLARSFVGQGLGLRFGDEAEGFIRSIFSGKTTAEEIDAVRTALEQFQEQNPVLSTGAEIAGAVALPGGAALRGATMGARALRGAGVGGVTGGIAGAGGAEGGVGERLPQTAEGAALGTALGAAAPVAIEGVIRGGQRIARAAERAGAPLRRAEDEAARQVAIARRQDIEIGDRGLTQPEFRAAQQAGAPVTNLELGGETTRGLARSAANQSPAGRALLNRVIDERFEGQGARIEEAVNDIFPQGRGDSFTRREQLRSAARRANRPAYERAYRDGSESLQSPELERLLGSPIVTGALSKAATRGRDRAIAEGFGGFNPNVTVTPDGRVQFRTGRGGVPVFPDLRLWDFAKRELDDAANAARRTGRNEEAATIGGLARQLRDELDVLVPSYRQARGTAQRFFNAGDALEAGQNFARQTRFSLPEARSALARMSQPERDLFREGFADELVTRVSQSRDRRNIVQQIYGSPNAREKMNLALGRGPARNMEALFRVEQIMDTARAAVQGNSTTTRQLVELGLIGGGAGAFPFDPSSGVGLITAGLLFKRFGRRAIDRRSERVARQVAELLTSNDPQAVNRAVQQISRNPNLLAGLRRFDAALARAGGQQAGGIIQDAGSGTQ